MNTRDTTQLEESAAHWESLADEHARMAAWDRERGINLSPGLSAGDHRARTFRATAAALRSEAQTGIPHCNCHNRPRCPFAPSGARR